MPPPLQINDVVRGFHVAIPDGFTDFPQGHANPPYIYAYRRGQPPAFDLIVFAETAGEITHGPLDADAVVHGMAAASKATVTDMSELAWQSEQLHVVTGTMSQRNITLGFTSTEVPVPVHGVMVMVVGPGSGGELNGVLGDVMRTFESEVHYAPDDGGTWELLAVVGGALALLGLVVYLKRRSSK